MYSVKVLLPLVNKIADLEPAREAKLKIGKEKGGVWELPEQQDGPENR